MSPEEPRKVDPELLAKIESATADAEKLSEEVVAAAPNPIPVPAHHFEASGGKDPLTSKQQKLRAKAKRSRKARARNRRK